MQNFTNLSDAVDHVLDILREELLEKQIRQSTILSVINILEVGAGTKQPDD